MPPNHGVQRRMISVDNFFRIFEIIIFCFVVAICNLVHDVETIFANSITHISEKISRCCEHLRKTICSLHSVH